MLTKCDTLPAIHQILKPVQVEAMVVDVGGICLVGRFKHETPSTLVRGLIDSYQHVEDLVAI